jgi:hypothetical protein
MNKVSDECGDDFLMWLTDCVYVKKESEQKARRIIELWGYELKQMNAKFISVTPNTIRFKNDKKHLPTYINYSELQDIGSNLYRR